MNWCVCVIPVSVNEEPYFRRASWNRFSHTEMQERRELSLVSGLVTFTPDLAHSMSNEIRMVPGGRKSQRKGHSTLRCSFLKSIPSWGTVGS